LTGKVESGLARRGETSMATKSAARPEATARKSVSKPQAAAKIASLIEEHMTERGFSEKQKNERVAEFAKRVDKATANHARR
jgi:hypothetical protein